MKAIETPARTPFAADLEQALSPFQAQRSELPPLGDSPLFW